MNKLVLCDYCGNPAELVTGKEVYPNRKDLHHLNIWRCDPCGARVGCHKNTTTPKGRLADAHLRAMKMAAHEAFDPLWFNVQLVSRSAAYRWLADKLEISPQDCHIGMFDVGMCRRVIEACNSITIAERIGMTRKRA